MPDTQSLWIDLLKLMLLRLVDIIHHPFDIVVCRASNQLLHLITCVHINKVSIVLLLWKRSLDPILQLNNSIFSPWLILFTLPLWRWLIDFVIVVSLSVGALLALLLLSLSNVLIIELIDVAGRLKRIHQGIMLFRTVVQH